MRYFSALCGYLTIVDCEDEEERYRMRVTRLIALLFFWVCYICLAASYASRHGSAVVLKEIEGKLFTDEMTYVETANSPMVHKGLAKTMHRGDIISTLYGVLESCSDDGLVGGDSKYHCLLTKVEVDTPPMDYPCRPQDIRAFSIIGDALPFGTYPTDVRDVPNFPGPYLGGVRHTNRERILSDMQQSVTAQVQDQMSNLREEMNLHMSQLRRDLGLPEHLVQKIEPPQLPSPPPPPPPDPVDIATIPNAERNHHWDILFNCGPTKVDIGFGVFVDDYEGWVLDLTFESVGESFPELYTVSLETRSKFQEETHSGISVWLPCVVLIQYVFLLFVPTAHTVLWWPYNTWRLYFKTAPFKVIVEDIIDAPGNRTRYSPASRVIFEDIAGLFIFIGLVHSIWRMMSVYSPAAAVDPSGEVISLWTYWRTYGTGVNPLPLSVLYFLFSSGWHVLGIVALSLRVSEATLFFSQADFLLLTLLFVMVPLLNLIIIYLTVLICFALIAYAQWGALLYQFSTLYLSISTFATYTLTFSERSQAESSINDVKVAIGPQALLFAFQFITIFMIFNFGNTLFVEAYNVTIDKTSSKTQMARLNAAMWYHAKVFFGFQDETAAELRVLGGVPGPVFSRAVVPHDNPLEVEKKGPDLEEIMDALVKGVKAINDLNGARDIIKQLQDENKDQLMSEVSFSESSSEVLSDDDYMESSFLLSKK